MTETQSGGSVAADGDLRGIVAGHSKRLDDHSYRLGTLEQDRAATRQEMAALQLKLVEVQTEGRMRGERQERDTRDLKVTTDTVKSSVDDILRSVMLLFRGLKWSWLAISAIAGFVAMYGDRLVLFWQHLHQ